MQLMAFGTVKDVIEPLQYDGREVRGYAARLPSSTYFYPFVEYGLFVTSFIFMHIVIFMLIYRYKSRIYRIVYEYVRKDKIEFCLFWSFILTFFLLFGNITFVFAVEGGFCMTLLQLYLLCISILPGLIYIIITIGHLKRRNGFFIVFQNLICVKIHFLDHLMQVLVFTFLFTLPHIISLVIYFSSVSFFYDPSSTSFLILYFSSSSIVLWIANAISIYLISPFLFVGCCSPKCSEYKKLFFAILLGLSINLMNFSVVPFIGDYFYDDRVEGTSIFAIVPIVITLLGWYISGDIVQLFAVLSFNTPEIEEYSENDFEIVSLNEISKFDSNQPRYNRGKRLAEDKNQTDTAEKSSFSKLRRVASIVRAVQRLASLYDDGGVVEVTQTTQNKKQRDEMDEITVV